MKIVRFYLLLVITVFSLGATCKPPPVPIEPKDTADCPAACEQLRKLGCEEGQPLEDGTTCEQFCIKTQKSGHALRPSCVMDIQTCAEIDKCSAPPREILE